MAVVNSKVEICNQALIACGASLIDNLTDDSTEAKLCSALYTPVLYAMLRKHNWNFATKRLSLTETTDVTPAFAGTFQLPEDFLKAIILVNSKMPYKILSDKLVIDSSSVILEYVSIVTDVSKYDALFVEAFAMELASRMIYKFNQSSNARQEMLSNAKDALRYARTADGQEGTQYNMIDDQFLQSRYASPIEGGLA